MSTFGKKKRMIFGLQSPRDDWFSNQLNEIVDAGDMHIDGLSIEFKGIGQYGQLITEIHGQLNPTQLRLLADAIETATK